MSYEKIAKYWIKKYSKCFNINFFGIISDNKNADLYIL